MPSIDNGSGYAGGTYASPDDTEVYLRALDGYLAMRNALWLDRVQHRHSGEFPAGTPSEICTQWQAENYLAAWAVRQGLIHPSCVKEDGLRHRQIGRLTAIIYHRDLQHRKSITRELARHIDALEWEAIASVSVCPG